MLAADNTAIPYATVMCNKETADDAKDAAGRR